MTVAAAYLPGQHRVTVREVELAALVEVALETGIRRLLRVDDRARASARLDVQAAGTVAVLAARIQGSRAVGDQAGMGG